MQGRFQILTLSGSFVYDATQNRQGKNGMLSVALCHPDGNIFGGAVAGALIAAEPVQVSFFFSFFAFVSFCDSGSRSGIANVALRTLSSD